jgi:DNA-binding ferritin-like protein
LKDLGEPHLKKLQKGEKIKDILVNIKKKIDIKNDELEKLRKKQNKERDKPTANFIHKIQNSTSDKAQAASLSSFI